MVMLLENSENKEKKRFAEIILLIIIVLSLSRIIYSFAVLKQDFHSDELWSFGLSNSYYEPFVFQSADHETLINYKEWFSSKVMRDYLTVDEEHRFSYDSVIYNQVHDYHPPLYYLILHTVCSFFPGEFSPWFGFSLNIVFYIVTILFLYKLTLEICKSEITSLIGCAFYSFSVGAVNTFVYIRMYCMETMISVILLYLHAKLYKTKPSRNIMILLFTVTLLGCLTHHFFIPYAGSISACFCIWYIIKKRYKDLFVYSGVMLAAVAVSVLLFPATIDHLFSGRINDAKLPFSWQIKMTLNCMLNEIFGVVISVIPKISYTALLIIIGCIMVIVSPLIFLFRNEVWFKKTIPVLKRKLGNLFFSIKHADLIVVCIIISSFSIILLTALTVSLINMWGSTDRYIFNIFPEFAVAFVIVLSKLIRSIIKNTKYSCFAVTAICVVFCAIANIRGFYNYFYTKPDDSISVKSVINDSNTVFVVNKEIFLLTCFTDESFEADHIYAVLAEDLWDKNVSIPNPPDSDKKMYFFIDNSSFFKDSVDGSLGGQLPYREMSADQTGKLTREEFENVLFNKYNMCEYIGYDTVFSRPFSIYRVR